MPIQLYAHPFSSYCQKVLIALYENDTPFEFRVLGFEGDAEIHAAFEKLWPIQRMPMLVDNGHAVMESSIIIEYLAQHYPGKTELIPRDPAAALEARFMDRFFDNYVMTPMQKIVFDAIRSVDASDRQGIEEARKLLDKAYRWLDEKLSGREWAAGNVFTLADCAAAPSLFFADWVHPIAETFPNVRAYRLRLLKHSSFARAVDGGRPYRHLFPLGAPDRD